MLSTVKSVQVMIGSDLFLSSRLDCNVWDTSGVKVSPGRVPFPSAAEISSWQLQGLFVSKISGEYLTFSAVFQHNLKTLDRSQCGVATQLFGMSSQELWTQTFRNFCPGRSRGGDFPERA